MEKDKMTLRDQFAMAALSGLLSNSSIIDSKNECADKFIAEWSYELADAMLKARGSGND